MIRENLASTESLAVRLEIVSIVKALINVGAASTQARKHERTLK